MGRQRKKQGGETLKASRNFYFVKCVFLCLQRKRRLHDVDRLVTCGTPYCSLGGDHGARRATPNPRDQLWAPTLQLSTKPRLPQLHLTGKTSSPSSPSFPSSDTKVYKCVCFFHDGLQSSCSPNVRDGLMSAKCSWGHAGDEGPKQTEGTQPSADPGRSAQRRFRSSAFPSSLSWDSDSEKETLDGNTWLNIYWKPVAHISRVPITTCSNELS